MTDIIINGCNGRMGQFITELAGQSEDFKVVAGIDARDDGHNSYPVFSSVSECSDIKADAIIDFSNPAAIDKLMDFCVKRQIPCVVCTTGLNDEQIGTVKKASEKVAILRSSNMSLGINVLMKVLAEVAPVFAKAGFDIEIVEKHHNQKLDAPSGTAVSLADAMNDALDEKCEYVYDRSGRREKRPKDEIGIASVRGGTIVGDHDVIFAGTDEVVTFSHRAYSRAIFAKGALSAAAFLNGKSAGMYSMADVIEE